LSYPQSLKVMELTKGKNPSFYITAQELLDWMKTVEITSSIPENDVSGMGLSGSDGQVEWSNGVKVPIDRIEQSLAKLRVQIDKLDQNYKGMRERDKQLLEICISAMAAKDMEKAEMYAEEVAEIRKMAKKVLHSQLVLEQVKIRLETLEEVGDIVSELLPFTSVINEVRNQLVGIVPGTETSLDELNVHIGSIIAATATQDSANESMSTAIDEEAKRILEEAADAAAEKVNESFPEIPCIRNERMVYEYACASPETFKIQACAETLGLTGEQVQEALKGLAVRKLIIIERQRELA
jgi:division protein CdvB (Snf7/Vps24/ESCRT-III family)